MHATKGILLATAIAYASFGLFAEDAKVAGAGPQKITTFLMFEGKAEEAMKFYTSLFKDSKIVSMTRYGKDGPGAEGTVLHATFTLKGQEYMAIDSPAKHAFTFTPSMSLYVKCDTVAEIDALFKKLSDGGNVMMPLDKYPFSERFGWVSDKYGVSWQLTLAAK